MPQTPQHPLTTSLTTNRHTLLDLRQRHHHRHSERIIPAPFPAWPPASPRRKERYIRPLAPRKEAQTRLSFETEVEEWAQHIEEEKAAGT